MTVNSIVDRVLTALRLQESEYNLQEIVGLCPDLNWNQVFLAIDYLTKTGQVRLRVDAGLTYTVQVTGSLMAKSVHPACCLVDLEMRRGS